jgi:signal peptidase I
MKRSAQASGDCHALKCELAGEVLRSYGVLRLCVTGHSMLPTVWPGDTLVIGPLDNPDVSTGDIVLFSNGQRLVAHRVVAKACGSRDSIETQGDAVPCPDSPVAQDDLMGKVSFILRNGRSIAPSQSLRFSQRAVAGVLRRSNLAARVVVGLHRLRRNSRTQASQVQEQ